jgi:DNA-binding FrmR family transcriptional regulator
MKATHNPTESAPTQTEAAKILADTAHAVKVMKASWLHIALNLKRIRQHRLWRFSRPSAESYDEYVLDVLKLNKYVANRMLAAMDYTEERRPDVIRDFEKGDDKVEVPSFDVVNQLRRVESSFEDREDELKELESRVYDDGVGRVVLKREINEKLSDQRSENKEEEAAPQAPKSVQDVVQQLMVIEKQLRDLKVSREVQKLTFQLVEALQKEHVSRARDDSDNDESGEADEEA